MYLCLDAFTRGRMRICTVSLVVALLLAFGTAGAHPGATGIVKERMDMMQSIAASMKRTSQMLRAPAEPDRAAIAAEAKSIAAHGAQMVDLFPAGTGGGVSEATPAVWRAPADFEKKARALVESANALAVAAESGDVDLMTEAFRLTGRTCSACHRDYRQKKPAQ